MNDELMENIKSLEEQYILEIDNEKEILKAAIKDK